MKRSLTEREKVTGFPAGYCMSIFGKGIRKAADGDKVYTLKGAKTKFLMLLILCTIAYCANLAFCMQFGGQANEDMRIFACMYAFFAAIFIFIFGWCSTITKNTSSRARVWVVGVLLDIALASFFGALSAGDHELNDIAFVVIPFAITGFVGIFSIDLLSRHVKGIIPIIAIITPVSIIPFWLLSLFFSTFKPGIFVLSAILCVISVFSFAMDLTTMKNFSERGDVDASYEWYTAIVAVFDLFIAIGGASGAGGAVSGKK
ncbi:hypothetical protein EJ419_07450 [Alloscardovia theropitheci]|uniref:Inhibitor of apoptosis-promoting Bax1 n=1 Tax=Alloscardovia theropitheci TaxID=2496842 RepID=A0A4R0QNP2_9BIFI|nr:hypothetical protein [Alloscardovia theropitheci]TCD53794.1 hypothetical protein EJ419_07450 [Alloscardovia theropitheci]